MAASQEQNITILGAGVIGLTTSLVLANTYPTARITVVAKHYPGDRSIEYTSPWAGANWSSMAHDNGPLEKYDEVTFRRFGELMDGKAVHGVKALKKGEGNELGLGRQGMWGVFDAPIEETGILTEETGKVWYDQLVGGLRELSKEELPKDAVFGLEFPSTFRINTQVYLQWLQSQALAKGIQLVRRHYPSVSALLSDHPSTTLLINCTGLGSYHLNDILDKNLYPTRGQTVLVAEPKTPINRMYFRSPKRIDPTTTYVFPRTLGGGVILGGSRQDNDWSAEWDESLGQDIMRRCCELCPELGRPEDLQIISKNIGLRRLTGGQRRGKVGRGLRRKRGDGLFRLCIAMGMLGRGISLLGSSSLLQTTNPPLPAFDSHTAQSIASFPLHQPRQTQLPRQLPMEAVKDTINTALEALHITSGSNQAAPAKEPSAEQLNDLKSKYEKAGQEQVFSFYDKLSTAEKAALFEQLSNFNPDYINEITDRALKPAKSESTETKLEPLPEDATSSVLDSSQEDLDKWYSSGLDLIAENKVAVVLMAGGQGTRLGSSAPKGCFDIGLPSKKSLFQLQGERIAKVQQLAAKKHGKESVTVPWYVMTSGPTRGPTAKFFEENKYFGLKKENVVIFEQGVLPCISNEGKILLESKSKVAVAPDGNGGLYQALIQSGVVQDMGKRGIQHIHAYCVDNCLVKVADPTFIGFSASKNVDIATKVVRKRNAKESVGLILQKNGKPDVVEYSEISTEDAEAKDSKDHELLKFRAANIVNHYYSFGFLESIPEWAKKLPHHVARKKIPYVNTETGETIKPEKPNGIKLEQFVFDCFPFLTLEKFACMEVKREDEFSPLKNARGTGEDDPDTSKQDILTQGKKWVQAAGATVVSEDQKDGIEVSPLISYGGEGLDFLANRTIKAPAVIESED
ncbi:Nn.00g070740.m01.CDS01 [Neocucurbitaria sp. VM-36]